MADDFILGAAHLGPEGSRYGTQLGSLLDALAQGLGLDGGRELVVCRLGSLLQSGIARVLDSGWTPDEISRVVRRRAGATAEAIVAGPLAEVVPRHHENGSMSAPWHGKNARKLDPDLSSWKADLSTAVAALSVIGHLPALRDLGRIRSGTTYAGSREQQRLFIRIRGLLSKAESSEFAEEADAFMTKAQELMTRHCVDRTMVDTDAKEGAASQIEARRVWLEDPYLGAKAHLLAKVARANRCRAVIDGEFGFSTVVGHSADLEATDLLFMSLLVQATRRITALGNDPTYGRRARTASYRRSFLIAYAGRIGSRLSEASEAVTVVADEALSNRLLPVLAHRAERLDAAIEDLFGKLTKVNFSPTDGAGWAAGTAAANLAELAAHEKLPVAAAP
jgi:hypothetical protein